VDHFLQIYRHQAAAYQRLITVEDADGHLLPALQAITPLAGQRVLDLGSGTGRIPLLLRGLDCEVVAVDLHQTMLVEQREQMSLGAGDWGLVQADLRELPITAAWADVVSAGWAIGHFVGWYPDDWRAQVDRALAAMQRAAKPNGTLAIMETLGTGLRQPAPPSQGFAAYYAYIQERGFARQEISTDYQFANADEAAEVCGAFFGDWIAERILAEGWSRVPEWTGIWSRANSPK
jgi:ubiquinone/menaquinone biosynthesis C-methylase UbiE